MVARPWSLAAACLLLLGACPRPPPAAVPDAGPPPPPPLAFTGTESTLLFSFVDPAGNVRSADKVADVPGPVRRNVMVVDLSRSPEERQADRYVYFVDVTAPGPDGKFHANVVSRYQVPLGKAGTGLPAGTDTGEASGVVLYSASWCGYCKKARAFFKQRNVPFQERDVEKDPGAEAALQKRARAAGVRVSGVPVIDFMGELVVGFDVPRLERLMARALEGQPSEAASGPTPVKRPAPGAGAPTSPSASP